MAFLRKIKKVFVNNNLAPAVVIEFIHNTYLKATHWIRLGCSSILLTTMLSACGSGGSDTTPSTSPPPPVTPTTPTEPTPEPTPQPTTDVVNITLARHTSSGPFDANQLQSVEFNNATGNFLVPVNGQSVSGNITLSVNVEDSEGIAKVYVGLNNAALALQLMSCSSNCSSNFKTTRTGLNLATLGATSGEQLLQLWVDDTLGNRTLVSSISFNWQRPRVTGVNFNRGSNKVNLAWNPLTNYLRYNVYVASESNLTPSNYQSKTNGQAFLALKNPNIALTGKEDSKTFYTLVTAIDGSGESAFSGEEVMFGLEDAIDLPPVAGDDNYVMDEDTTLTDNLLNNDSDIETPQLIINQTPITAASNGAVVIEADGTFSYTPNRDFSGRDGFVYEISDGVGKKDSAIVTIIVNESNDAPESFINNFNLILEGANRHAFGVDSALATNLNVQAPGLLINTLDIDSASVTLITTPEREPVQGSVELHADGSFIYTPNTGASGEDSFSYRIVDSNGAISEPSEVKITINGSSFPPRAASDRYELIEDQVFVADNSTANRLSVIANDTDEDDQNSLTMVTPVFRAPFNGVLSMGTNGTFSYTPKPGFYGVDSFVYQIKDSQNNIAQAAVILRVKRNNTAPNAVPDNYEGLLEDTEFSVSAADGLLSNDRDPDFDPISVNTTPASEPNNGTVVLAQNGSFVYSPNKDFNGLDSFEYQILDDQGATAIAIVRLRVINVNDPPVAVDDEASTLENTSVNINVLANDSDIENNQLQVTSTTVLPSQGSVIIESNNTLTFKPSGNFTGNASIEYTISDGQGGAASATVLVLVGVSNRNPVAVDDNYNVNEDVVLRINGSSSQPNLLANDSDPDGDNLTISPSPVSNVSHGTLSLAANGNFNYNPNANFFGSDSFRYQVRDNKGGTTIGTVNLTINPVNDNPVANDDSAITAEETLINIDVLANDTDIDNDSLSITSTTGQTGIVTIEANNTLNFTPPLNFFGVVQIDYQISDNNGGSDSAQVSVTVQNVNDAPIANPDTATTLSNQPVTVNVLANDSDIENDTLSILFVSAINGSAIVNQNNTITFTPTQNFAGNGFVDYTISDGNGGTASSTLSITVTATNSAPVAVNDFVDTNEDNSIIIDVLLNDSDPDSDPLTVISAQASNGNVTIRSDQKIEYTPPANFFGTDIINYSIEDGQGNSASAAVTVTVIAVNDLPIAANDTTTLNEDTTTIVNVLNNDSDADSDTLTVVSASASNGSVSILPDNTLSYLPFSNFNGTDTINYSISDGQGGSASAVVFVTIIAVNDIPISLSDSATTNEDEAVVINVLANDSDADSDTLTVTSAIANNGSISILSDNSLSYLPNSNFNGTDTISYSITDNQGGNASAEVFVTVTAVNDIPVVLPESVTTNEDNTIVINVLANDSDVDSTTLTVISASAAQGTVTIQSDQQLNYLPNININGTDTINYVVSDSEGATAASTVSVTIVAVNDPPVAVDDSAATNEEKPVVIDVLTNDSDVDGDPLTITSAVANTGTVVINNGTTVEYTPNANFTGTDTVNYTIADPSGATASAKVVITVLEANDSPVAVDDVATTNEDTLVNIKVLANDTDIDSPTLTVTSATAENGQVLIKSDGSLDYTPKVNFNGTDIINYAISDNELGTASAKVTVTVIAVNDAPIAKDDTATTTEDTFVTIEVLANDSDVDDAVLLVSVVSTSNGASLVNPDNSITYFPDSNFFGEVTLNYQVADSKGLTATAKVTITVSAVNDVPVAINDSATTQEDTSVVINVLANDSDADGDPLTITVDNVSNGTITSTANQLLTFAPTINFNGQAQIGYSITDGKGGKASATVTINVAAVNDAPIAVADTLTTTEDSTNNNINVLANDTDVDGDILVVTSASASNGKVIINTDKTLNYQPNANFNGNDVINYNISDGHGGVSLSLVNITVTAVNDPPVAENDSASFDEDVGGIIDVLANDSDIDSSDKLKIVSATANNATITIIDASTAPKLRFIPDLNFNGNSTITYVIADNNCTVAGSCGEGHSATATVAVTVKAVNDTPTATDATTSIPENAVNGRSVITVSANDVDDTNLQYSLQSGNSDGIFGINATSGEITVVDKSFLDFETTQQYILTVKVSDPAQSSAFAQITINIEEVVENVTPTADSSFGNTTIAGVSVSNAFAFDNQDTPQDAAMDSSGRVIMVGSVSNSNTDISVSRYNANGQLDLTFGIQGRFSKDLGSFEKAVAVAVDASNNSYVAGEIFNGTSVEMFIVKFLASGTLDSNFGNGGLVTSNLAVSNLKVADILVHSDGSVAVLAGVNNQFSLYKYNSSNGAITNSATFDMTGDFDTPTAMVEQNDGKVIMVGYTADAAQLHNYDFAVARLDYANLTLDSQFASAGKTTFDLGSRADDMAYDVRLNAAQDIILVGATTLATDVYDVALAVLDSTGVLKTDFGTAGIEIIDADGDSGNLSGSSYATNLALDNSENWYIGVQFGLTQSTEDFGVVKLTASGSLDTSFGTGGIAIKDLGGAQNTMVAVMLNSSNQPVIATSIAGPRNQDFAITRLTTSGVTDNSFGNNGNTVSNHSAGNDILNDGIELKTSANSGKFIYTGAAQNNTSTTDLVVARYTSTGALDVSFGNSGYFRLSNHGIGLLSGQSIAELSDGRLAVVGVAGDNAIILLLDSNGRLDTSFASGGVKTLNASQSGLQLGINSVAVDSNNKITFAGYAVSETTDDIDIYLGRLNTDGSFDSGFGSNGEVRQNLGSQELIEDMTLLSDNSLVVVGSQFGLNQSADSRALIAKFTSSGALDTSGFAASAGYRAIDTDSTVTDNQDSLTSIAIATDGTLYAAGASSGSNGNLSIMIALTSNGSFNIGFGSNGLQSYDFGSGSAARAMILDGNGQPLLTGVKYNASNGFNDIYIVRLTTSGATDPLFNSGNPFSIDYNNGDDVSAIMALADGRIMITGDNLLSGYSTQVWYAAVYKLVQ